MVFSGHLSEMAQLRHACGRCPITKVWPIVLLESFPDKLSRAQFGEITGQHSFVRLDEYCLNCDELMSGATAASRLPCGPIQTTGLRPWMTRIKTTIIARTSSRWINPPRV